MATKEEIAHIRDEAWLGDAVLSLYVRQYLLRQEFPNNAERTQAYCNMTSNQFLASLGEPTAIEARIGRIYAKEGLEVAHAWIADNLLPVYQKQENNRQRGR